VIVKTRREAARNSSVNSGSGQRPRLNGELSQFLLARIDFVFAPSLFLANRRG
jgi:hypothetical protein